VSPDRNHIAADPYDSDYDQALLAATALRHMHTLPAWTNIALSSAVDELIDPLTLPALLEFSETDTHDPTAVLLAVRGRLAQGAQTALTTAVAMARARAARQLHAALTALGAAPAWAGGEP